MNMKKLLILIAMACPAILWAQPKRQLASDYHYRRASLFEVLPIKKSDIVFLGNSITDGAEWHELFGNKNFKNRGISADKTYDVLDRLDPILEGKPKKVFLMIGVNDLNAGFPPEAVVENIGKIADRFARESPKTRLYIQSILPVSDKMGRTGGHQSKTEEIIKTNQLLRTLCAQRGLTYLDIYTELADKEGKLGREYSNDGLHLMGAGYIVWRDALRKHVK